MKNYLKSHFKKLAALALVIFMLVQSSIPTQAAEPFSAIEIYGYEGTTHITVKDDVPLRSSPSKEGEVIEYLPKGYPIESEGLFRTNRNTLWIKVKTSYTEAWCFTGNLTKHNHNYLNLENQGYDFEFCTTCGHLMSTSPESYDVDTLSSNEIHMALAVCSAFPVVGNGCDIVDSLFSLSEGDYIAAALGIASALPMLGKFAEVARTTGYARYIDDVTGYAIVGYRAENLENIIRIVPEGKSTLLGKHMDDQFKLTGDIRFRKVDGVARHHIVAGNALAAGPAQKILAHVGIDVNSFENGVYLCSRTQLCNEGTIHAGGHSKAYYETVNEMITSAYNSAGFSVKSKKAAVVDKLDEIARLLMEGKMPL